LVPDALWLALSILRMSIHIMVLMVIAAAGDRQDQFVLKADNAEPTPDQLLSALDGRPTDESINVMEEFNANAQQSETKIPENIKAKLSERATQNPTEKYCEETNLQTIENNDKGARNRCKRKQLAASILKLFDVDAPLDAAKTWLLKLKQDMHSMQEIQQEMKGMHSMQMIADEMLRKVPPSTLGQLSIDVSTAEVLDTLKVAILPWASLVPGAEPPTQMDRCMSQLQTFERCQDIDCNKVCPGPGEAPNRCSDLCNIYLEERTAWLNRGVAIERAGRVKSAYGW